MPGSYENSGLFTILPQLDFNKSLRETISTKHGLLAMIFPGGESVFEWFAAFNENSLKKFGVLNLDKAKAPTFGSSRNLSTALHWSQRG